MSADFDDDDYWLECIRRSGSNSCVAGWGDMKAFIQSGRADDRTLSGFYVALRALSQEAQRQLSERREAQRLARYGIGAAQRDSK
jgi:hypothetical protein